VCLFLCVPLFFCLYVSLSFYLSFSLWTCLSVCFFQSVCLSAYLSVCLPVCLSVCLSACLSIYLSGYRSGCRSCLSIYLALALCLSVFLFFSLFLSISLPKFPNIHEETRLQMYTNVRIFVHVYIDFVTFRFVHVWTCASIIVVSAVRVCVHIMYLLVCTHACKHLSTAVSSILCILELIWLYPTFKDSRWSCPISSAKYAIPSS